MKRFKFPNWFSRKKKKMRASVRRASASGADWDDASEPNMKLSRALLIVLLLHVVAVAGIIAFNAIKSRQGVAPATAKTNLKVQPVTSAETKSAPSPTPKRAKETTNETVKYYVVARGDSPASIAKKFKISAEELLAANHFDNPRKLQIGQRILIPKKTNKTRKGDE